MLFGAFQIPCLPEYMFTEREQVSMPGIHGSRHGKTRIGEEKFEDITCVSIGIASLTRRQKCFE
jgi:hypothetical protein